MISGSALSGLRIGPVSYLNTKPLIWGLDRGGLYPDVPAVLARKFFQGQLDAALLPVFEVLRAGGGLVVDDVAIACLGDVYSVIVASRTDFPSCGAIHLDPASRSSAALLRVLLAEYYPGGPVITEAQEVPAHGARLLIGDAAMEFRKKNGDSWRYHDLGGLWKDSTGLPFVFAVWAVSERVHPSPGVFAAFRTLKAEGLAARPAIAALEDDPAFALRYLTDFVRYDLRDPEKMALRLFEDLCRRHGILPPIPRARMEFR